MVLLVLVWWRKGLDASGKGAGDKRWEDAIDDVTWVLEQMMKVNQHMISVAKTTSKWFAL